MATPAHPMLTPDGQTRWIPRRFPLLPIESTPAHRAGMGRSEKSRGNLHSCPWFSLLLIIFRHPQGSSEFETRRSLRNGSWPNRQRRRQQPRITGITQRSLRPQPSRNHESHEGTTGRKPVLSWFPNLTSCFPGLFLGHLPDLAISGAAGQRVPRWSHPTSTATSPDPVG